MIRQAIEPMRPPVLLNNPALYSYYYFGPEAR
jgi:hypothetical protein